MKLICKKTDLVSGINIVMKAVPSRTTMPILECILIDAENGNIQLTANDLELGIRTNVDGEIKETGSTAIDAKVFSEIVKSFADSDVIIETSNDSMATISCENAKFNIPVRSAEDFQGLPMIEKTNMITISQFALKNVIMQTIFAINDMEKNKILTGELFEVNGNNLKVVALDKFRIAIRYLELKEDYGNFKVLVPGKSLNEISKILEGNSEKYVDIYFTENHILFEFDKTSVVSRLIDSTNYFDTDKMISSDYRTKVKINKKDMSSCIDRASLLVREEDKKPVIFSIENGNMKFSIDTQLGSMDEQISVVKEGEDMSISFNPKFLTDVLKVLDEETVDIYFTNQKAPCYIRDEKNSYIYIVLPIVQ